VSVLPETVVSPGASWAEAAILSKEAMNLFCKIVLTTDFGV
jgi:hypothetical protein